MKVSFIVKSAAPFSLTEHGRLMVNSPSLKHLYLTPVSQFPIILWAEVQTEVKPEEHEGSNTLIPHTLSTHWLFRHMISSSVIMLVSRDPSSQTHPAISPPNQPPLPQCGNTHSLICTWVELFRPEGMKTPDEETLIRMTDKSTVYMWYMCTTCSKHINNIHTIFQTISHTFFHRLVDPAA